MVSRFGAPLSLLGLAISIVLLFSNQLFAIADNETGKPLIEKTCSQTKYPQDCISALESDPRSISATNLNSLSKITLDVASSKVNEVNKYVQGLWSEDYGTWAMIENCQWLYNQSIYAMKGSLNSFDAQKYKNAYQSVDEVNGHILECNSMNLPRVQDRNKVLLRFVEDTKAIIHLLF